MVDIDIVNEKPITLCEVRDIIDVLKKDKKELNFRETKSIDYINSFVDLKTKDAEKLRKELEELGIGRLKERHIIKLIDIMPADLESLKLILTGEEVTLKLEDLTKIIEVIKKYAK